jgi:hypothetical protein
MQTEKSLLDENFKLKEDLVQQYQTSLEQETKKSEQESKSREDLEMQLSKTKVDWALLQQDSEVLIDCITDLGTKFAKKKCPVKESYETLRSDKIKATLLERLAQAGVKHDV